MLGLLGAIYQPEYLHQRWRRLSANISHRSLSSCSGKDAQRGQIAAEDYRRKCVIHPMIKTGVSKSSICLDQSFHILCYRHNAWKWMGQAIEIDADFSQEL